MQTEINKYLKSSIEKNTFFGTRWFIASSKTTSAGILLYSRVFPSHRN